MKKLRNGIRWNVLRHRFISLKINEHISDRTIWTVWMKIKLKHSIYGGVKCVCVCMWHENTISNQINNDEQWQRKTAINLNGMNKLENIHSKCTPIWLFMFVLASIQMNQFNRMIDMYMNMNNIVTVQTIFQQFSFFLEKLGCTGEKMSYVWMSML